MCPAGKHSVKEHYLLSYRKAMAAVVRAQFSASKASAGGRAGALALADNEHILQSLCCEGADTFPHHAHCLWHLSMQTTRPGRCMCPSPYMAWILAMRTTALPSLASSSMAQHAGVDLRAYEKSSPSDRDSGLVSNDSSSEPSSESGWMPDWTRSALDEIFGPLAETATMLYMSRGKSDEGGADIVGS